MVEKKYYPEIDIIKGFAIILVMMGHSFCVHPIDIEGNVPTFLIDYIRTFQMPLFFIASGFLFNIEEQWPTFIKKKIWRLFVPYLVFCFLSILLRFVFSSFTNSGAPSLVSAITSIASGGLYWFLYVLFLIMVICKICKSMSRLIVLVIVSLLFCFSFQELPITIWRLSFHLPFFIVGVIIRRNYTSMIKVINRNTLVFLTIGLIILYPVLLFHFKSHNEPFKYLNIFVGCIMVWSLSLLLSKNNTMSRIWSFFGKYSLQYYLNHLVIMLLPYMVAAYLPISQHIVLWILIFFMGLFLSTIMLYFEKKIKLLHSLCGLGK